MRALALRYARGVNARSELLASLLALVALACGGAPVRVESAAPAPGAGAPSDNGNGRAVRLDVPVAVRWGAPQTTPGCFFFSGPGELGRDDHLGEAARLVASDRDVRLAFDTGPELAGGAPLGRSTPDVTVLGRASHHEFGGRWTVRESLTLTRVDEQTFRGTYHYDEIAPDSAVPGECHIDVAVVVESADR